MKEHIRNFVVCHDDHLIQKIKPGNSQFCYRCKSRNISIFTVKGTIEELDSLNNAHEDEYYKLRV